MRRLHPQEVTPPPQRSTTPQRVAHRHGTTDDPDALPECGIASVGSLPSSMTPLHNVSECRNRSQRQAPSACSRCSSGWSRGQRCLVLRWITLSNTGTGKPSLMHAIIHTDSRDPILREGLLLCVVQPNALPQLRYEIRPPPGDNVVCASESRFNGTPPTYITQSLSAHSVVHRPLPGDTSTLLASAVLRIQWRA